MASIVADENQILEERRTNQGNKRIKQEVNLNNLVLH